MPQQPHPNIKKQGLTEAQRQILARLVKAEGVTAAHRILATAHDNIHELHSGGRLTTRAMAKLIPRLEAWEQANPPRGLAPAQPQAGRQ